MIVDFDFEFKLIGHMVNWNFDIEFEFQIVIFSTDPGRVRVSVRVRPRNGEELKSDADFADLVELQPEVSHYAFLPLLSYS